MISFQLSNELPNLGNEGEQEMLNAFVVYVLRFRISTFFHNSCTKTRSVRPDCSEEKAGRGPNP